MERSFDLGALLKNHEKKHKLKPVQFVSVVGGVQKRLETNLKGRRSSRLTLFDKIRNLPRCESPAPLSEAQLKVERRRQQLEKWKEDKEKRKKELAAQKKKPFVAGVAHNPLKFVPPPPPKAMPSSSGRVTRSQSAKTNVSKPKVDSKPMKASQSFAPKNASFRPPEIKNLTKLPTLAPVNKNKKAKSYTFNFTVLNNVPKVDNEVTVKPTRTKAKPAENRMMTRKNAKELEKVAKTRVSKKPSPAKLVKTKCSGSSGSDLERPVKSAVRKASPKMAKNLSSSSSSEMEISKAKKQALLEISSSSSSELESKQSKNSSRRTSNNKVIFTSSLSSDSDRSRSESEKSPILKMSTPMSTRKGPKVITPKSESSTEERLRSPKSPVASVDVSDSAVTPQIEESKRISPCVTMSRGKANARKEMKQKIEEGLLDEDNSEAESIEHFRRQLSSEVTRLTELCDTWDKIREQSLLAETVQDEVLGAVGQGRLLISSKLQQFAGLVERCAKPEPGSPLITPADLHGFWDMVFMQIENVDMRFKRLELRRSRGWTEEPQVEPAKKNRNHVKRVAKPTAGPSRLREMIAAARKAKKEQTEQPTAQLAVQNEDSKQDSKTFEAGFFCVRSPVRSPAQGTPNNKHSLLKAVLSSEAKKASASKNSSSFAMLRASIMSRNLEAEGIAPLPQTPIPEINMNATPGRSILKSTNLSAVKSGKKSIKVVLFDDSDTDLQLDTSKELFENQNTDSGLSSMENKENQVKPRLSRQDAVEDIGVVTKSRRKSIITSVETEKTGNRRSSRRKTLQDNDSNVPEAVVTPKRTTRRRKSNVQAVA